MPHAHIYQELSIPTILYGFLSTVIMLKHANTQPKLPFSNVAATQNQSFECLLYLLYYTCVASNDFNFFWTAQRYDGRQVFQDQQRGDEQMVHDLSLIHI